MRALQAIGDFGATHVGAGVVEASGTTATNGETDRVFALASLTKLLTTYAVLLSSEEGLLALDEPAGPPGSTVAHLLAHASGLDPNDAARVLAPPGTRRIYSSAGYEVLGALVAARAEMSFADYLRTGVLEPLAMAATHCDGHPGYGASGTVADWCRFAHELLAPRLIDPATLERATTVAFPGLAGVLPGFGRFDPCDWGLGFEIRDDKSPHWTGSANSPATFGHFGRAGGFIWVDPQPRVSLVVLSDRDFGPWAQRGWPPLADDVLQEVAR